MAERDIMVYYHDVSDVTGKEVLATHFRGQELKQTWFLKRMELVVLEKLV